MNVLVLGSGGYIGSALMEALPKFGHVVSGFDIGWFAGGKGEDIRDGSAIAKAMKGQHAVVNLASVSSDKACQLDETLARAINCDAFEAVVIAAREAGVKRFIHLSSSAVYGSTERPAKETDPLLPTTIYSQHKAATEPILMRYRDDMACTILRPGAVFGFSPRMRFDTTVNMMTNHAVRKGVITVNGGTQARPLLHMFDLMKLIGEILEKDAFAGEIFNVGWVNLPVGDIANIVAKITGAKVEIGPATDNRSYQLDCTKLWNAGFFPQHSVEEGVELMYKCFRYGAWADSLTNPAYMNVPQWVNAAS